MIRIAGARVSTVNVQLACESANSAARARHVHRVLTVCEPCARPEDDPPVPRRDARRDRPAVQRPRRSGDVARVSRDGERERGQCVSADERGFGAGRVEPAGAAAERDERRQPDERSPACDRVQRPPSSRRLSCPCRRAPGGDLVAEEQHGARRGANLVGRPVLDGCARLAPQRGHGGRAPAAGPPARSRSASSVSGPIARANVSRSPLAPFSQEPVRPATKLGDLLLGQLRRLRCPWSQGTPSSRCGILPGELAVSCGRSSRSAARRRAAPMQEISEQRTTATEAPGLPADAALAERWAGEPFLRPDEDPAEVLAPGTARRQRARRSARRDRRRP